MKRIQGKSLLSLLVCAALTMAMFCVGTTAASAAIYGDMNGDGVISTSDARDVLRYGIGNIELSASQVALADYNGDGKVDTADARDILIASIEGAPDKPFIPDDQPHDGEIVRGFWVPYMEVEAMYRSGNAATVKAAIDACLDDCVARGANTVYYHVRANSDAYYNSSVFDEGYYTTTLLNQGFDPFAYAVQQAHAKGLKIEAWINPYRIGADASRAKTDAIFVYQNRYYYVPSDADVQKLVVNGVKELVNNYAIDGVQFDDYFYPEGAVPADAPADFETADYTAYKNGGGNLGIADWRRNEVNKLVSAVYNACHVRTGCVFGISPACDIDGNFNEKYADAAAWAKTPGYVDYLAPQLYVGFKHIYMPFDQSIAKWDALERHSGVKMVAGLALYKTGLYDDTWSGEAGRTEWLEDSTIMMRQIALTEEMGWYGVSLYSHQSITADSTRDPVVAAAEVQGACNAWRDFGEDKTAKTGPVRAFWIAYMEVDTMLSSGDPTTARAAIAACFDDCVKRGTNTVYFHVRANSDAYYNSSVYPENSKTATLLNKGFDPLAVAVELAHERGLKIEAWVNPYRIGTDTSRIMVNATFKHENRYYYVPSNNDVHNLVVRGVREIVQNYDVDGIQIDDYFYPEGSATDTAVTSFESADYAAYQEKGGKMSVANWRRNEVSTLVSAIYNECHAREGCTFGISPACDYDRTYNQMYADIGRWAKSIGYTDYLAPQIYVGYKHAATPFLENLTDWDTMERHDGVQMIAGLAMYKVGAVDTWAGTAGKNEWIENSNMLARQVNDVYAKGWSGAAFYSHKSIEAGSGRDATIVNAEVGSGCWAWRKFE